MYNIDLFNYMFDKENVNMRLFDSIADRELYFDSNSLFQFKNVNFNANDIITTQIVIDYSTYSDNIIGLLNCNYLRAKNQYNTLYFWIEKSTQLAGERISMQLRIDEFQTYIYDLSLGSGMINRVTYQRFNRVGSALSNEYVFNSMNTTELFKKENFIDFEKRLIKREKLKLIYNTNDDFSEEYDTNNWLYENVKCWVYYYISSGKYNLYNNVEQQLNNIVYTLPTNVANVYSRIQEGATVVLCYPVYKPNTTKRIKIVDTIDNLTLDWDFRSIETFLRANNGTSYVYSVKYSMQAPFNYRDYASAYIFSNPSGNFIINVTQKLENRYFLNTTDYFDISFIRTGADVFCGIVEQQDLTPKKAIIDLGLKFKFTGQEIIQNANSPEYNPKALSSKCIQLTLTEGKDSYSYDIQQLNTSILTFEYYEIFAPDLTKTLTVYVPENSDEYLIEETSKNYSGLVTTNDYSVMYSNDRWQEFLAQNKNFFLQTAFNSVSGAVNGALSNAYQSTTGALVSKSANYLASDNIQMGALSGATKVLTDMANMKMNQDNMISSPDILKNASGNAIFLNAVTDIGVYVNVFKAISSQITSFNDFLNEFGVVLMKHDSVNSYLRVHKNFDYVEFDCEYIIGHASEDIKNLFKSKLKRGVRFWYINAVNYELPNYPKFVEDNIPSEE